MRLPLFIITLFLCCSVYTFAATPSLQSVWYSPKRNSEAIIFYNPNIPCPNCNKTISLLANVLNNNYRSRLRLYFIDTKKAPEFIPIFKLKAALTLVVIRVSDGAPFGFKALTGLTSETSDPISFANTVTEFINNFLSLTP